MANGLFVNLGPFFSAGALCTSPKLYHYNAGLLTDKDIWSDRGETTPLAQPFVGDANGVFAFYGDGLYKFVIKDSADNTLYTWDNVLIDDLTAATLGEGASINSASTTVLGSEVWAHITGTTTIDAFSGTSLPFFWAVFDGSLTLTHSSNLILNNSVDRLTEVGDVIFFLNEGSGVWRQGSNPNPAKVSDIASASSITAPAHNVFVDVTGTTAITSISTKKAGHKFQARFTGAGLDITYNASSMITPWAVTYKTVPNEILEFRSLGSGNWIVYSLNGPKERTGVTIEGNTSSTPAGYLLEDGTSYLRTDYAGLFAEIGTTFGAADGTHFNVPDSLGRVAIHVDGAANRITAASTNGANADTLGGVGGTETHTISTAEMPAHTHSAEKSGAGAIIGGTTASQVVSSVTGSTGGGGAHSNTQPWIAKKKFIRF